MRFIFLGAADNNGAMLNISTGINSIGLPLVQADHEVEYRRLNVDLDEAGIIPTHYDVALVVVGEPRASLPKIKTFKEAGVKVVAITDGVAQYLECRHNNRCVGLLESLRLADVVLVNSSASEYYYKTFLEDSDKVHSIGFPIQRDWILEIANPYEKVRDNTMVYQGFSPIGRQYHNGWYQLQVAQNLGYTSVVTALNDKEMAILDDILPQMYTGKIIWKEHVSPGKFLDETLSSCGLAMYFPQRPSLGRTAAECAVLGIPCFGTRSYFQEELFPMLAFDELSNDIPRVIYEVMNNDSLRQRICDDAIVAVESYLPDNYYLTFMRAIGERL